MTRIHSASPLRIDVERSTGGDASKKGERQLASGNSLSNSRREGRRGDDVSNSQVMRAQHHHAGEVASVDALIACCVQSLLDPSPISDYVSIHQAAESGDCSAVLAMLDAGRPIPVDGRAEPDGESALFVAASNGYGDICDLLIGRGADVNFRNSHEDVPLHGAARSNRVTCCRILLAAGAEINPKGKDGVTPLHEAASGGYTALIRLLLSSGADLNAVDADENTALHLAAENGHFAACRILLDQGANPSAWNTFLSTPLHAAASKGNATVVRLLLKYDASLNAKDEQGHSPLMEAAMHGHVSVVQALVEQSRLMVESMDRLHENALHKASAAGHLRIIQLLVGRNANVRATNYNMRHALHLAAGAGRHSVVSFLLESGAPVNARDLAGSTALHLAAANGHIATIRSLLDMQPKAQGSGPLQEAVDVDASDARGRTPLMQAAEIGNYEVVEFLVQRGADVTHRDINGQTAADVGKTDQIQQFIRGQQTWTMTAHKMFPYPGQWKAAMRALLVSTATEQGKVAPDIAPPVHRTAQVRGGEAQNQQLDGSDARQLLNSRKPVNDASINFGW